MFTLQREVEIYFDNYNLNFLKFSVPLDVAVKLTLIAMAFFIINSSQVIKVVCLNISFCS